MTASECISYIDAIEPNAYTSAQKLGWLNEIEGKVYTQLFLVQPNEFAPVLDDSRILSLPAPHDRIYSLYLQAMIHYANGEYDRYANSMAVFNQAWGEANRWFGGDFDVTDRMRNRSFEVNVDTHSQIIMEIPDGCAVVAGKINVNGFASNGTLTAKLTVNGREICTINLTTDGVVPLPMLMAGRHGSDIGIEITGTAAQEGTITFAGRLLISDQAWTFDPAYARRRDARWHG